MDNKVAKSFFIVLGALICIAIFEWLIVGLFASIGFAIPAQLVKLIDVFIVAIAAWKLWLLWKGSMNV